MRFFSIVDNKWQMYMRLAEFYAKLGLLSVNPPGNCKYNYYNLFTKLHLHPWFNQNRISQSNSMYIMKIFPELLLYLQLSFFRTKLFGALHFLMRANIKKFTKFQNAKKNLRGLIELFFKINTKTKIFVNVALSTSYTSC